MHGSNLLPFQAIVARNNRLALLICSTLGGGGNAKRYAIGRTTSGRGPVAAPIRSVHDRPRQTGAEYADVRSAVVVGRGRFWGCAASAREMAHVLLHLPLTS